MKDTKYKEIFKLRNMLESAQIDYEFFDNSIKMGGEFSKFSIEMYQICVVNPITKKRIISVIQGNHSYGGEDDLLEIMGLLTEDEQKADDVAGYLTADEVFARIKQAWDKIRC